MTQMPFLCCRNWQETALLQEQLAVAVKRKMLENAIATFSPELTTSDLWSFPGLFFCHKFTCVACLATLFNLLTTLNHFQNEQQAKFQSGQRGCTA